MRIAIISDIHEDIIHLQKAFIKLEKIKYDKIICLGDISGYGIYNAPFFDKRNAHSCLDLVKKHCEIVILGNHDLQAVRKIPQQINSFNYPENWYALDYYEKIKSGGKVLWLYEDELDPLYAHNDIEFLRQQQELQIVAENGRNYMFSHYAFPNVTGSLRQFNFEPDDYVPHFEFMEKNKCRYSFIGHEHANGLLIIKQNRVIEKKFTRYALTDSPAIIISPAIVSGKKRSGFLIFDTESLEIEAIKI